MTWHWHCNTPGGCPFAMSWGDICMIRADAWLSFLMHGWGVVCWSGTLCERDPGLLWFMCRHVMWGVGCLNAWPLTLHRWAWQLLVIYFHSSREEETTGHTGPQKVCTQEQSEPAEAEGGWLCRNKRERCPLVPVGGWDWLVWIIHGAGGELRRKQACAYILPHDEEGCLGGGPYLQEQRGERRPSWLHMLRQHRILHLNFRSHTTGSAQRLGRKEKLSYFHAFHTTFFPAFWTRVLAFSFYTGLQTLCSHLLWI